MNKASAIAALDFGRFPVRLLSPGQGNLVNEIKNIMTITQYAYYCQKTFSVRRNEVKPSKLLYFLNFVLQMLCENCAQISR